VLLVLVPCFWRCPAEGLTLYFPGVSHIRRAPFSLGREPLFFALVYTLFVTALASPIRYDRLAAQERKGRDLVLALDTSGSMAESGFDRARKDKRKFDLLVEMVNRFLDRRFDDNIGLVMFGTFAYPASPVTYDLPALKEVLKMVDVGIAGESTAIGEGIETALRALTFGHAKKKVIVLITDGYANSGSVSIKEAVAHAKKMGVKLYTVGVGKPGQYDAKLLARAAKETGGESFGAKSAEELARVFEKLDALEPSPIRSQMPVNKTMLYLWPLLAGMVLLIGYLSWRGRGI